MSSVSPFASCTVERTELHPPKRGHQLEALWQGALPLVLNTSETVTPPPDAAAATLSTMAVAAPDFTETPNPPEVVVLLSSKETVRSMVPPSPAGMCAYCPAGTVTAPWWRLPLCSRAYSGSGEDTSCFETPSQCSSRLIYGHGLFN